MQEIHKLEKKEKIYVKFVEWNLFKVRYDFFCNLFNFR